MVEVRTFTVRDALGWFGRAWKEAKPFRAPLLGISLIILVLGFGLAELGNLPRMIGEVLSPFAMAGVMLCARDCVVNRGFDFHSFLRPFTERDLIERLFPYAIACYTVELFTVGATQPGVGSTFQVLLALVAWLLTLFLPYLLLFTPSTVPEAFKLSAQATLLNFRPVILLYLMIGATILAIALPASVGVTVLATSLKMSEHALDSGIQFWIFGLILTAIFAPPFWLFCYIAYEEIYAGG
jgi:hypothetical protein